MEAEHLPDRHLLPGSDGSDLSVYQRFRGCQRVLHCCTHHHSARSDAAVVRYLHTSSVCGQLLWLQEGHHHRARPHQPDCPSHSRAGVVHPPCLQHCSGRRAALRRCLHRAVLHHVCHVALPGKVHLQCCFVAVYYSISMLRYTTYSSYATIYGSIVMLLYSFFYLSLSLYVAILCVWFPIRGADHPGGHLRRDHHRHVLLPGTLTTHSLYSPTPCVCCSLRLQSVYLIYFPCFCSCAMKTTSGGGAPSCPQARPACISSCTPSGTTAPSSASRASCPPCCTSPTWPWSASPSSCSLAPSASSPACGSGVRSTVLSRWTKVVRGSGAIAVGCEIRTFLFSLLCDR